MGERLRQRQWFANWEGRFWVLLWRPRTDARDALARRTHTHLGSAGLRLIGFLNFFVSQIRLKAESASHIPFFIATRLRARVCSRVRVRTSVAAVSLAVARACWRGLPDCKRRCISHQVQFCNAVSCLHRFAKLEASNTPLSVAAAAAVVEQSLQQRDRRSEPRSSSAPKSRLQLRPRLAPPSNSPSAAPSVRSAPWIEW